VKQSWVWQSKQCSGGGGELESVILGLESEMLELESDSGGGETDIAEPTCCRGEEGWQIASLAEVT
jgi:hypothetical protein